MDFAPGNADAVVLREQYMRDIIRAFVATSRCPQYFEIIFSDISDDPTNFWNDPSYRKEVPLDWALPAVAAVGNFKAFDNFFYGDEPKVLTGGDALYNPLTCVASTGKSVMIEYLLVKMQKEIMEIDCVCQTPLDGPLARDAECECEMLFYRMIYCIKAAMRNNNVRAAVKMIEGLPKHFPYLVKRDQPNFLYLAMECSSLVLVKKLLAEDPRPAQELKYDVHILVGCYEALRNDDMAIVFYLLSHGIVSVEAIEPPDNKTWLPYFNPLDVVVQHNQHGLVKLLLAYGPKVDFHTLAGIVTAGLKSFPNPSTIKFLRLFIGKYSISEGWNGEPKFFQDMSATFPKTTTKDPMKLLQNRSWWEANDFNNYPIDASFMAKCENIAGRLGNCHEQLERDVLRALILVCREIVLLEKSVHDIGLPSMPKLLEWLGKLSTGELNLVDRVAGINVVALKWEDEAKKAKD
jgi:hypothetical protein